MTIRSLRFHLDASADLIDIWKLVDRNDGADRADRLLARIEAFCRSLPEFPEIGRTHDDKGVNLRSVSIPGLPKAVVVFYLTNQQVTILRIAYLGRNVWTNIPAP